MAFGQEDPSRTEKATPKQRKKQRNKGNVPKGQEIGKVMTLLAGLIALRFLIGWVYNQLHEVYTWFFREGVAMEVNQDTAYGLLLFCMQKVTLIVLPIMLIVAVMAFVTMRLQVGHLWTTEVFKPKFSKMFNIMKGIKKLMLSPEAFVRLARNLLTASAVAIAPYLVLKEEKENLLPLFYADTSGVAAYILSTGYRMIIYALVPMMVIALIDLWYTRWNYNEQLKMTKEEVKDERKQAEGDPKIKQQQRMHMMRFMAKRMMEQVPRADVVVTNPTHYAVALRYDVMEAPAPLVLAKGVDKLALRIIDKARESNVPIRQDPPLAQALYRQVEIGDTIPEELYQAVAAILAKLDKFRYSR